MACRIVCNDWGGLYQIGLTWPFVNTISLIYRYFIWSILRRASFDQSSTTYAWKFQKGYVIVSLYKNIFSLSATILYPIQWFLMYRQLVPWLFIEFPFVLMKCNLSVWNTLKMHSINLMVFRGLSSKFIMCCRNVTLMT